MCCAYGRIEHAFVGNLAVVHITLAETDAEFAAVQALFDSVFRDIAPDAVPRTAAGQTMYRPIIAQYHDEAGQLVGAALTCRAAVAAMSTLMPAAFGGYGDVLDKHSELDLIAVRPDARNGGVGSALIEFLERELKDRGVHVWFGNATQDLDTSKLREFYIRHGFTVGADGAALPKLLGHSWRLPSELTEQPAFTFYKSLQPSAESRIAPPSRPVPPDPLKARRPKKAKKSQSKKRRR